MGRWIYRIDACRYGVVSFPVREDVYVAVQAIGMTGD